MAKVKVTLVYDYGGDMETNDEAIAEERKAIVDGEVDFKTLLEIEAELTVEIIGDVSEETEDEDDEDEDEDDEEEQAA